MEENSVLGTSRRASNDDSPLLMKRERQRQAQRRKHENQQRKLTKAKITIDNPTPPKGRKYDKSVLALEVFNLFVIPLEL